MTIPQFTDAMLDLETTGLDPACNGILQVGIVMFNYNTEEIGPVFNRCPALLPRRFWDDDTRALWFGPWRSTYETFIPRFEEPAPVFHAVSDFLRLHSNTSKLRVWAKPTWFDISMLSSHFTQLGLMLPFHHRFTRDLNTTVAALSGSATHQEMLHIEVPGGQHDAVVDCVHQLKMLFAAKRGDFGGAIEVDYEEVA